MGRPKKRILLICKDEASLATHRFLLETKGYYVVGAIDAAVALEAIDSTLHVAVVELECMNGELPAAIRKRCASLPVLLFSELVPAGSFPHGADALLGRGFTAMDWMERIRVMAARKRGPQPKPPVAVHSEDSLAPYGVCG